MYVYMVICRYIQMHRKWRDSAISLSLTFQSFGHASLPYSW